MNSDDKLPDILFHYTGLCGLRGIILGRSIRATEIHCMNDESEFRHAFDLMTEFAEERLALRLEEREAAFAETVLAHIDHFRKWKVFVVSLTEKGDLLSQWRGYCPKGGFSLGFDAREVDDIIASQGFHLVTCQYDRRVHRSLVEQRYTFSLFLDSKIKMNTIKRTGLFLGDLRSLSPLLKHEMFFEEQEWRLISEATAELPECVQYHEGGKNPYRTVRLEDDRTDFPLRKVLISPTGSKEALQAQAEAVLEEAGLDRVEVQPSRVPLRVG